MKRTTLDLGPFGVYLWGAILLVGGLAFAGGAALTANSRGTIFPQQLANGTAVPGYIAVAGYCTDTATGTSAGTSVANGQCWKEFPSGGLPQVGDPGRVLGVVTASVTTTANLTATHTVVGTFTTGGTAVSTWSYPTTYTLTTTGTATTTGTKYAAVNGTIYAGSGVTLSKGTDTATTTAVDLKDQPKIHAPGVSAPLSDEVPQPSGALPGQAGTGTGYSRDTHKHHLGSNYPAPGWVLRAGPGTSTETSTGLGAGWEPFTHASTHQPGGDDAMTVDAPVSVGSLRTIGEGSMQACSGGDYRLSNARTPTAHASTHQPGGSDQMAVDAAAATGSLRTLGTGAQQACPGNDSRLSNARTPTAHASTHKGGGSDVIDSATQSVAGLMSAADKLKLDGTSSAPQASVIPVSDSSGELTPWVKVFKDYSSGSCSSNYSIAQSTWTTVASIPCTISGGGAWFITGLVQFVVTANDYVGIRFTLDSTDIALSDRLVRVIRDLSSYVYSSINTTAIIPISDSNSHTCNLQVLRQDVADTMTVNCSSDTNQFAHISAIKLYK